MERDITIKIYFIILCVYMYDDALFITILSMAEGKDEFVYFDEIKKFFHCVWLCTLFFQHLAHKWYLPWAILRHIRRDGMVKSCYSYVNKQKRFSWKILRSFLIVWIRKLVPDFKIFSINWHINLSMKYMIISFLKIAPLNVKSDLTFSLNSFQHK